MKPANKIGLAGTVSLALAGIMTPFPQIGFENVSLALQWVGMLFLIYSGIRESRWWLMIPVAIILFWIWGLSQGH